jgi:hypothetical protein
LSRNQRAVVVAQSVAAELIADIPLEEGGEE